MQIGVGITIPKMGVLGGDAGVGLGVGSALQRILALSPSLLIWPDQGAGWQGTSGGTLAASGQPLGLGADLAGLGGKTLSEWLATAPELISNGDFSGGVTTGWTAKAGTTFSVVSGAARVENAGAATGGVYQTFATVSGVTYRLSLNLSNFVTAGTARVSVNNGTSDSFTGSQYAASTVLASQDIIFTAAGASSTLALYPNSGVAGARFDFDNVSIKALPGNHLRAGTWATPSDAARGTFQNSAISFDGSSDYYSLLNAISITTNMTVVRAFKRASAGIRSAGLSPASGADPRDFFWQTTNAISYGLGATSQVLAADTTTGNLVSSLRRNATNEYARLNGVQIDTRSAPAVSGAFANLGNLNANYNSGEISFLAVFPTELTGADLALVEQIAASTNGAVLA